MTTPPAREPNTSQLRSGDSPDEANNRQVDGFPQPASVFLDTVKERRGPLDAAEKDFTGRAEHGLFTFDVGNLPGRRAAVERREPQAQTYHRYQVTPQRPDGRPGKCRSLRRNQAPATATAKPGSNGSLRPESSSATHNSLAAPFRTW